MTDKQIKKLIQEGKYIAEVDVALIETEGDWSPFYSLADVHKLDAVRAALKARDFKTAAKLARLYELKPIAAE